MREIKFRAWNEAEGKMYQEIEDIRPRFKIHLMQYTGLKDKNGKEIYEGDIVIDNEKVVRLIKWENGSFWARESLVGHLASMIDDKIMYDPEVIGNIYEHSELLTPTV